nr:hypothetical protein [Lacticaseibacillus manihotivorans]
MQYENVEIGHVIKRISRFTVQVELNGDMVLAHLSNTGRNKELLVPGHNISIKKKRPILIAKPLMIFWQWVAMAGGSISIAWRLIGWSMQPCGTAV